VATVAGDRLAELRAALAQVYDQIEQAVTADEAADTSELEHRANRLQDDLDAILDAKGIEIQQEIRNRPRPDPPPGADRLF
jgi:hypothetical protein